MRPKAKRRLNSLRRISVRAGSSIPSSLRLGAWTLRSPLRRIHGVAGIRILAPKQDPVPVDSTREQWADTLTHRGTSSVISVGGHSQDERTTEVGEPLIDPSLVTGCIMTRCVCVGSDTNGPCCGYQHAASTQQEVVGLDELCDASVGQS